jgi:thiol:disulfide interchange protein
MRRPFQFLKLTLCCLLLTNAVFAQQKPAKHKAARQKTGQAAQVSGKADPGKYIPVHTYDPARNAEQDILAAVAEAGRTGKRILLEVGGQWCIWCHIMDDYFEKNPSLLSLREKNFITVKINFSEENKNEQVLSHYPPVSGYPFIFVLDKEGKLLHAQDTGKLEEGKSYNLAKFTAFLKEWSPPETNSAGK